MTQWSIAIEYGVKNDIVVIDTTKLFWPKDIVFKHKEI